MASKPNVSLIHPIVDRFAISGESPSVGIASSLWAGIFVVEPSAKTGIHHHGEQDTVI